METKKFKLGNADGVKAKAGHNNTQTILTSAGVVAVGAVAGVAGYAAGSSQDNPEADELEQPAVEPQPEGKPEQHQTSASQQPAQSSAPQQQPTEPTPDETPADETMPSESQTEGTNPSEGSSDELSSEEMAQQILNENNIDPGDIDVSTVFAVNGLHTIFAPDGSEILVADIYTPDGSTYMLADLDGDGKFTDVLDMAGNVIGEAEGNLVESDLVLAYNNTGNYLHPVDNEPAGADPGEGFHDPNDIDGDIIDPVSDEELLAQLDSADEEEHFIDTDDTDSDDIETEDDITDEDFADGDSDIDA